MRWNFAMCFVKPTEDEQRAGRLLTDRSNREPETRNPMRIARLSPLDRDRLPSTHFNRTDRSIRIDNTALGAMEVSTC